MEEARAWCGQIEWHLGDPYPGLGFIVTNLGRRAERVVAFYNQRGTAHGRYVTRQMTEVAVSRQMFADIPSPISGCWHRPAGMGLVRAQILRATRGEVSLAGKASPVQHSGAANRPRSEVRFWPRDWQRSGENPLNRALKANEFV